MKVVHLLSCWLILLFFIYPFASQAQTEVPWKFIGPTQVEGGNFDFYYYKIAQINAPGHRYGSMIELSIQGDANYFVSQGTYLIRIDKWDNTPDRFDGMEIRCTSGNPIAATFYVFNNALWVKSNYKWGGVYIKAVHMIYSPVPEDGTFGQTTTAPTGFLATTADYGLKCDFDGNRFFKLPFTDVVGVTYNAGGLSLGVATNNGVLNVNGTGRPNADYIFVTRDSTSSQCDIFSNYSGGTDTQNGILGYGARPMSKAWQIWEKGYHAGWENLFHVGVDGNVGIGTINPQAKLAVKGSVLAQRVKVSTTADSWPDYVFNKNYALPSLQEVENYIEKYQHLPGIPAAAEVAKDGHDLGEMNKQLLQKVEELTLYIIDLQKRIVALEQQKK
ncbi:tail fiber protein [Chitinophaga qingshengii]|uniref:Peptidase S74 domain-containing protein n=1 Tax=Chitinophaga qingshengii TaxID=1569794 RepID=A0ABR7TJZ3_9BACT|nr:tail fiber protein [Chitinophaga qingshengii]MBC9929980.1 hypothetical protein [Chitinophaga qingshengii]